MAPKTKDLARIFERIKIIDNGCWEWQGARSSTGYGNMTHQGKQLQPHRVAYELEKGFIPRGMHVDHVCQNRRCINPDHLEAVTPAENTRRGGMIQALLQRHESRTHCDKGHPLTPDNIAYREGPKRCLICVKEATKRGNAVQRAKIKAANLPTHLTRHEAFLAKELGLTV